MNRVVLTSATLPASVLAELQLWLGITTSHDDDLLARLLAAALETCEAFTGQVPLACTCEEVHPARSGWQVLAARPVRAIATLSSIAADGTRVALAPGDYALEIDAEGAGRFRLEAAMTGRLAVTFSAGLAEEWDALPEGLRHGVVRLAAHQHREREGAGAAPLPPAAVAALWRPWRRLRLA